MSQQKNTAQRLSVIQRQHHAVRLRMQNMTFQQIADALNVSVSQTHRYVQNALKQLAKQISEDTEELRALHLQRIDRMAASLWPEAQSGNTQAITTMLKLMEREANLIGLDAPPKKAEQSTEHDEIVERLIRNASQECQR